MVSWQKVEAQVELSEKSVWPIDGCFLFNHCFRNVSTTDRTYQIGETQSRKFWIVNDTQDFPLQSQSDFFHEK